MSVEWMDACPAAHYVDGGLETFVDAPRYRQTAMPDGGVLQESNGPPFIDRKRTAGDIALHLAAETAKCSGPCQGGEAPCLLSQEAFRLLAYASISQVPRSPLT